MGIFFFTTLINPSNIFTDCSASNCVKSDNFGELAVFLFNLRNIRGYMNELYSIFCLGNLDVSFLSLFGLPFAFPLDLDED
mgnify:CR=1 FL=1